MKSLGLSSLGVGGSLPYSTSTTVTGLLWTVCQAPHNSVTKQGADNQVLKGIPPAPRPEEQVPSFSPSGTYTAHAAELTWAASTSGSTLDRGERVWETSECLLLTAAACIPLGRKTACSSLQAKGGWGAERERTRV